MDEAGKKLTERTITITVREDDFDVKLNSEFTVEEVYHVLVSLLQHIEQEAEEYIDYSAPSMLQ